MALNASLRTVSVARTRFRRGAQVDSDFVVCRKHPLLFMLSFSRLFPGSCMLIYSAALLSASLLFLRHHSPCFAFAVPIISVLHISVAEQYSAVRFHSVPLPSLSAMTSSLLFHSGSIQFVTIACRFCATPSRRVSAQIYATAAQHRSMHFSSGASPVDSIQIHSHTPLHEAFPFLFLSISIPSFAFPTHVVANLSWTIPCHFRAFYAELCRCVIRSRRSIPGIPSVCTRNWSGTSLPSSTGLSLPSSVSATSGPSH